MFSWCTYKRESIQRSRKKVWKHLVFEEKSVKAFNSLPTCILLPVLSGAFFCNRIVDFFSRLVNYHALIFLPTQEGFAFSHCTTCKAPYYLRVHSHTDRKWRTLKFRFFVTRDILFIFALVQMVSSLNVVPLITFYWVTNSIFLLVHPGHLCIGIFGTFYWWVPAILVEDGLGFW